MEKVETSYWALVLTRNGGEMIQPTIESIIKQTVPPKKIFILDDGSTDVTPLLLRGVRSKYGERVTIVTLEDRGYDIRRVAENINTGIESAKKAEIATRYLMISGDDCVYPQHYCEYILNKMNGNQRIVVASGDIEGVRHPDETPRGAGRFIRTSFLSRVGGYFPPYYGYEGWILQKALQLGYTIMNYPKARYRHLRRMGEKHKFKDWGLAMKCLGYYPLEVLYRFVRYALMDRRVSIGYMRVLWDYFIYSMIAKAGEDPYYHFFDEDLRDYIRRKQKVRIMCRVAGFLKSF